MSETDLRVKILGRSIWLFFSGASMEKEGKA